MEPKKVSIIIPTRNRANYLSRAIQSVLSQDYTNIEIIVADNASSDDTEQVVKKYKTTATGKNIIIFRNSENIGMAANWNKALMEYASGEYVLVLPDDDRLIDNRYISKAMDLINMDPEIVVVFANYQKVDLVSGIVQRKIIVDFPSGFSGKWFWLHYWEKRDGYIGVGCPQLTTLYSRKVALGVGGYFLDIHSPDTLLVLHVMLHGKVGFIPDIVAEYGLHPYNASKIDDPLVLYKDLEYVRVAANHALSTGVSPADVKRWKKRIMAMRLSGIQHMRRNLLNDGVFSTFKLLALIIVSGDGRYLLCDLSRELLRLYDRFRRRDR